MKMEGMRAFGEKNESERDWQLRKRNVFQMPLALRAYQQENLRHGIEEEVDVDNPRANSHEIQKKAVEEWEKYSAKFNALVKKHPDILDSDYTEELDKLFTILHQRLDSTDIDKKDAEISDEEIKIIYDQLAKPDPILKGQAATEHVINQDLL